MVAPEPETNREFTQSLASALHRIAIFPLPKIVLNCLLGESSCLLLDSQKVVPHKLMNSGFNFAFDQLKPALNDLLQNDHKEV